MYINGNLENIITILTSYKSNSLFNKTDIYHMDISVLKTESKQIAISKNKLTPIEDIHSFCNSNTNDTIIWVDKYTYDLLHKTFSQESNQISQFLETSPKKQKTDIKSINTKRNRAGKKIEAIHDKTNPRQNIIPETNLEHQGKLIENHDYDCVKVNRPAAFAIKKIHENYFLLFYRKSVYDAGTDLAFRKYLNEQPGVLVVYKYLHSIDNLRNELIKLGLKLRHNGKNELSDYQVNKLLNTFNSLSFL